MKKEEWYYFTFGYGQPHEGKCVKIKGDYGTARAKMCEKYGIHWAFQYSEDEWLKIEADPKRWWPMEEVMEVIEQCQDITYKILIPENGAASPLS